MQDYLEYYRVRITALSPIHIGGGVQIGKKEYIQYGPRGQVIVPDQNRMFQDLCRMHKDKAYAEYMIRNGRDSLSQWLTEAKIDRKQVLTWADYTMDPGDAFVKQNGGQGTPKGIMTFVKDAYGMPYVPGSSIKGMLRTALLTSIVRNEPERFGLQLRNISSGAARGGKRNTFLTRETMDLEAEALHDLGWNEKRKSDAVNSVMSGLIVSDSEPISVTQLMLSQKIDYSLDRQEKPLPILREALMPGTEIEFSITLDRSVFPYSMDELLAALDDFQMDGYQYFYSRFGRGTQKDGVVWLGGGVGYLSKTILYSIYGDDALPIVDNIFKVSVGKQYSEHHHEKDRRLGVAPHVCKCTRYRGKLYDMGMGRIEVIA